MIEIHTLGWKDDHGIEEGEQPNGSIYARVFVDGVEVPQVMRVRTRHENDFAVAVVTLHGPIEVINHTRKTWEALPDA
jgi:hypothetical protein